MQEIHATRRRALSTLIASGIYVSKNELLKDSKIPYKFAKLKGLITSFQLIFLVVVTLRLSAIGYVWKQPGSKLARTSPVMLLAVRQPA